MSWAQGPTEFWYMNHDILIKGGNCNVLMKLGMWFAHISSFFGSFQLGLNSHNHDVR